jgi:hypothetical protein
MRYLLSLILFTTLISCDNSKSYQIEEQKAIEDITNDYVSYYIERRNPLPRHDRFDSAVRQRGLDTTDIKVYVSDALLPISQVFEDNDWMRNAYYDDLELRDKFIKLHNSATFKDLKYREFNKEYLELNDPYKHCYDCKDRIESDEQYSMISFSRICFNQERDFGLVVIDYGFGYKESHMSGHHGPFLIKKDSSGWRFIPK